MLLNKLSAPLVGEEPFSQVGTKSEPIENYNSLKEAKAALKPKEKKLILIGIPEGTGMWMYFEKEEFDSSVDERFFYIEKNECGNILRDI